MSRRYIRRSLPPSPAQISFYRRIPTHSRIGHVTRLLPLALPLLLLAGCASPSPTTLSGPPGSRSSIDGIDVWKGGPPDRPYHVIATVQRQGADNSATFDTEEKLLAADASDKHADAIIILDTTTVVSRMDVITGHPIDAPKVDAQFIQYQ